MPIKKITCHVVAAPVARPFTSSRGWLYKTRGTCLVEIETDDGIVGWGECYGPSAVAKAFIDTQLAPRVIGRDPFDVEVIWEDLYNRIKDYGPKGMSIAAISGIDIALWDIIGKSCNKPIHKLIGGAFRTEVDAYATGLYFTDMDRLVDEAVEEASGYVRKGFKAIKMKIGLGSIKRDFERVKAVRDAIGPDVKLMVDANHCLHRSRRDPARPQAGRTRHRVVRGADFAGRYRRVCRGIAGARHGGSGRRERIHPLGFSRRHRAQGDGYRAA